MATRKAPVKASASGRAVKSASSRMAAARGLIGSNASRVNAAGRSGGVAGRNKAAQTFKRAPAGGKGAGASGG